MPACGSRRVLSQRSAGRPDAFTAIAHTPLLQRASNCSAVYDTM